MTTSLWILLPGIGGYRCSGAERTGRWCDFVVGHANATIESAQLAKKNLEAANANIIGAVLNGFDLKSTSRDTGYYYSYEYGYYK